MPTHVVAALRLESGALATLTVSFEATEQYDSRLLVHGSEGTLALPDANAFEGEVRLRTARGDWESVAYESYGPRETRGLGLDDLVESLRAGRPHRASGEPASLAEPLLHRGPRAGHVHGRRDVQRADVVEPLAAQQARAKVILVGLVHREAVDRGGGEQGLLLPGQGRRAG